MLIRLLLAFLGFSYICSPCLVSADDLKVGVMLHLGGDFAAWGQAYLEGIEIARAKANAEGGVGGKQISLIVEDIRFDSRVTATASKKLLEVDKVPVALISTFTEVMVAGPMFERAKVPLLVIGDSGEEIDRLGSYVFSTGTDSSGYSLAASHYFREKFKIHKVAIIATNNPWSQANADAFNRDFIAGGGKILLRQDLNPQEADFRTVLQQVKRSGVDAVFAPITSNAIPFFQQAQQLNVSLPILAAGGVLDTDIIEAAPHAVEGRYVTNSFLDKEKKEAGELLRLYDAKYHHEPRYPSVVGRGYDGFMTLLQALRGAAAPSPKEIAEAMYKVDFEGAGFHVQITPQGGARLPAHVLQVNQGKLVRVD